MFLLLFDIKVMRFDQLDLSRQFLKTEMKFLREEKSVIFCVQITTLLRLKSTSDFVSEFFDSEGRF